MGVASLEVQAVTAAREAGGSDCTNRATGFATQRLDERWTVD